VILIQSTCTLSILTAIFQVNLGQLVPIEAKDYGGGGDNWSYKSCKAPAKSSPTNQHPVFLQAGCHSCHLTNSVKALKGKYHISWTCLPQAHLGVFQLCLWPLIAPGYLGGGVPCLSSAVWCRYPNMHSEIYIYTVLRVTLPVWFRWMCFRSALLTGIAVVRVLCTALETGPQPSATELLSP